MLDVFDLAARITLDSGDFELGLESVTRALSNFIGDSIKTGQTFDKAMSQVAATRGYTVKQLNATQEELAAMSEDEREAAINAQRDFEALRAFAQEQGRTTVFTATQAAEALNYMALAGYDAEMSMKTLPAVLNLAAAGDLQLGYASDVVTDAQTALGLSTEETFALVEQMAKTASTTNTSVGQLAEAILTIGGTATFMKGGTEELTAVFGILADNGIKGSEAGIHLRNMLLKLAAPTDKGANQIAALDMAVMNLTNHLDEVTFDSITMRNNFNEGLDAVKETIKREGELPDELVSEIKETLGDEYIDVIDAWAEDVRSALSEMGDSAEEVKRHMEMGSIVFDDEGNLRYIQDIFNDINVALDTMNATQEDTFLTFDKLFNVRDVASATALMNTSAERWEKVNTAIEGATASTGEFYSNLQIAMRGQEGSYEKLFSVLHELNIGADQFETAWRTSGGTVGMFMQNLSNEVGEINGKTVDVGAYLEQWGISLDSIQRAMDATQGAAGRMAKTQLDNLAGDVTLLNSAIEGAQIAVSDALSPTLRELSQFGATAVSDLTEAFQQGGIEGVFLELGDVLKLGGDTIFNALSEIITGADWITIGANVFGIIIDGVSDAVTNFPETLETIVGNISKAIEEVDWIEVGNNLGTSIASGLVSIVQEGGTFVSKIFGIDWADLGKNIIAFIVLGLGSTVISLGGKLIELAQTAITDLLGGEGKEVDWVDTASQIITKIGIGFITAAGDLASDLIGAGAYAIAQLTSDEEIKKWLKVGDDLVQGIISGISAAAKAFADGAVDLANSALQAIKDFLHIQSPSKVFRDEVGKMMALGLGEGFEDNMPIDDMVASTAEALNEVEKLDSPTITAFGDSGIAGLFNNMPYNQQPVVINVYARADQNEKDVAKEVQRQFLLWDKQRKAALA